MTVFLWIVQAILLAAMFAMSGLVKVLQPNHPARARRARRLGTVDSAPYGW